MPWFYLENKNALPAGVSLVCLEIRSRNEEFNTKQVLLAKGFSLPTYGYLLFICFWIDLVGVVATTGNTSAIDRMLYCIT